MDNHIHPDIKRGVTAFDQPKIMKSEKNTIGLNPTDILRAIQGNTDFTYQFRSSAAAELKIIGGEDKFPSLPYELIFGIFSYIPEDTGNIYQVCNPAECSENCGIDYWEFFCTNSIF